MIIQSPILRYSSFAWSWHNGYRPWLCSRVLYNLVELGNATEICVFLSDTKPRGNKYFQVKSGIDSDSIGIKLPEQDRYCFYNIYLKLANFVNEINPIRGQIYYGWIGVMKDEDDA